MHIVLLKTLMVSGVFALGAFLRIGPENVRKHKKIVVPIWAFLTIVAFIIFKQQGAHW